MEALANATSFVSPVTNADLKIPAGEGILGHVFAQLNGWTIALTLFLLAVVYDQCTSRLMKDPSQN